MSGLLDQKGRMEKGVMLAGFRETVIFQAY